MLSLHRLTVAALPFFLAPPAFAKQPIVLDGETIVGDIHKPQVMMVITRQNLASTYQIALRESFLSRIAEAAEKGPF